MRARSVRKPRPRRGMTLAEVMIATALTAVVALSMGYVTVLMTSAATRIDKRSQTQTEAAVAFARLRGELEQATAIVSLASQSKPAPSYQVRFKRPAASGSLDDITYQWSGRAGDPLTRKLNSADPEAVLSECQAFTLSPTRMHLTSGKIYPIKLEFYSRGSRAACTLKWSATSAGRTILSSQVIPYYYMSPAFSGGSSTPYRSPVMSGSSAAITGPSPTPTPIPTPTPTPTPGSRTYGISGQYYSGITLTNLILSRTDSYVDFTWTGSPATGLPAGNFSVRWVGMLRPSTTRDYTFTVRSRDGVRLWVNGCLVIDAWSDRPAITEVSGSSLSRIGIRLEAGPSGKTVALDGAVGLLNLPSLGS